MVNLVIGYGNPLRRDDGAGWRVADLVAARRPDVAVRQLHQLVPEVAQWLSEVEGVVVLVDTAVSTLNPPEPPGTIQCQEVLPEPLQPSAFSHHVSTALLLGMAHGLYGRAPRVFLVTIVGGDFGYGEGVSTAVENALPQVVEQVEKLLNKKE